jgi:hypothetical protein
VYSQYLPYYTSHSEHHANFEAPRSSSSGPRRRTPHHRAQARVLTAGTCVECLLLPRKALPPRRRTAGDRRRSLAGLPRAGTVPPGAAEVPANAQPERRTLIARYQGGPPPPPPWVPRSPPPHLRCRRRSQVGWVGGPAPPAGGPRWGGRVGPSRSTLLRYLTKVP